MTHLTDAVLRAVQDSNWYAALALTLALPDIAGWVEDPEAGSRARYAAWVEKNLTPKYTSTPGGEPIPHKFLSGDDCYALRCAFLHEGRDDTAEQKAADALTRFQFTVPPGRGSTVHCNQIDAKLQLQVDIFCRDMCVAVIAWLAATQSADASSRLATLAMIRPPTPF